MFPFSFSSHPARHTGTFLVSLLSLLGLHQSLGQDAVFTSGAFTSDATSGINASKTYTALGNIIGGNVTVNGVTFTNDGVTGLTGAGWTVTDTPNTFPGGGNHTTTFDGQAITGLFDGFQYNGSASKVTMTGLTVGQTYVATLYNQAWTLPANRTQNVTSSEGASIIYNEDALEASALRYTFVATGTSTTLTFSPQVPGSTMHLYGLSNEQVFNNTWSPASGNSWNTAANWTGGIPDAIGSNASFSAQAGPTSVTVGAPTTTGHIEFLGTGSYTVSGSGLTLQADAGGSSVLKADAGGVHTISSALQLNSPLSKFGAGAVTFTGAVTGSNNGVTIGSGTLGVASTSADLSSLGPISNSGTFVVTNAGAQKMDAVISGTGSFTKGGAGTFTLGGQQMYTGSTEISGGTLTLASSTSIAIANNSFQSYTSLANGTFGYNPAGASWTFNTVSGIALNGSPWFGPTNHDNSAGGFIQSNAANGLISQSITVPSDGLYNINFEGVSRGGVNGPNGILLQIDGVTVKAFAPGEFSQATWQTYTASVNLTAGAHTIAFVGNNLLGGDRATVIDLVTAATGGKLPTNTALNLTNSGATLDLNGQTQSVGSLSGVAGTSVLNTTAFTIGGNGGSTTFDGVISGAGTVTKVGAGALSLGGVNLHTGPTNISAGTVRLTGGSLESSPVNLTASGATFDLNNNSTSLASLNGVSGSAVTLGSGTLTVGSAGTKSNFSGSISGAGGLTKVGTGVQELSGAPNYTGPTTISAGTLKSTSPNAASGTVGVAAGATWDLAAGNHTITGLTGNGNVTRTGAVSTGADGAALISTSKTYVQKLDFGNNAGATVNSVTFDSVGLSGPNFSTAGIPNVYGGPDSGGYDQLVGDFIFGGNPGSLTFSNLTPGQVYEAVLYTKIGHWGGRAQNFTFDEDGAGSISNTLLNSDPGNFGYYAYRFAAPTSSVTIMATPIVGTNTFHWFAASLESVSTSTPTLTIGDAGNYAYSGVISGMTQLIKQGTGTQELFAASTYTGGTTISSGTILAHHAGALGTGDISIANGANYLAWWKSSTLAPTPTTITNNFVLNGLGGNFPGGSKGAIYADGGAAGGSPEYTISGQITLAATSNVGGNVANALRLNGKITGTGGLTKGGGRPDEANILTLGNTANDYAGDTLITKGTVKLGASEVIPHGAGKGAVIVDAGTALDLGGFSETINALSGAGSVTSTASAGTPVKFNSDATSGISNAKTYTHALDFAEGSSVTINGVVFSGVGTTGATHTLAGAGAVAGNGATGATGDISRLLNNFNYGDNTSLTLTGLTPGQTYETRVYERIWGGDRTQAFTVTAGTSTGTTLFDTDGQGGPVYVPFRYTADASGQVTIATTKVGAGGHHWYGASNEEVAGPRLTFGDASNQTFSGVISGPLSLTKQGSGTQILTGASTYTGETRISAGSLLANNASGSATGTGNIVVESGATFGGTGAVAGFVTTQTGGILSPGASIESLTVGSAAGAGTYLIEFDGTNIDFLTVIGSFDLTGSTVDFDSIGSSLTGPSYVFASYGSLTGTFSSEIDLPTDYAIDYNFGGGNQIALVAVPEPSGVIFGAALVATFALRRRRK